MKIEELSVGNWILCHNTIKKQIKEILKDSVYVDDFCYKLNELKPIYIKDVIDKLGFEKMNDGAFEYYNIYYDEYLDVRIEEYTDRLYLVSVSNNEWNFPTEFKLLSTIHQLQNFLTGCNADLKIEL